MAYSKTFWVDYPDNSTPITASRLNNLEDGVEQAVTTATTALDTRIAVDDAIVSGLLSNLSSAARQAVVSLIALDTSVVSAATNAVQNAVFGLNIALRTDFNTTDNTLYGFPGNTYTVPNGTYTKVDVIDATALPPSTNVAGTNTTGTVGGKAVSATTTGSPVFTTDATQTGFKIISGAGTASFISATNSIAFKITALPTFGSGTARGMAVFLRGNITTTSYMFGMVLSSNGNYQLGFFGGTINNDNWDIEGSGTGAAAGYTSTVSITKAAAIGDVGILSWEPTTSTLTLTVNGTIIRQGTLSSTQIARMGTRMGVWGRATVTQIPSFEWVGIATENTTSVVRKLVTTDVSGNLPATQLAKIETYLNGRSQAGALYDIRRYGAKCDGILLKDGAMTAGSNQLTSTSRAFTAADIGKRIGVMGAATVVPNVNGNGVLIGSISNVIAGVATLTNTATVTVTGAEVMFGTNDDAALVAARDAAAAAGGGTVLFPVGNTVVNATHTTIDNVSYAGADRFGSVVWPIKLRDFAQPVGAPMTGPWLYSWTTSSENPNRNEFLQNVDVHDFTVQCRFWAAETSWSTRLKPLSLANCYNSQVYRMTVIDSPATAIPWDASVATSIHHNLIINPGRLFPTGSSGGSGIGVGTGLRSSGSQWIAFNTIVGTQTATVAGRGHNGIFIEYLADPTDANNLAIDPLNIIGNTIIGMPFGITEAGGTGSIIADNQLRGCGIGIAVKVTPLSTSYPGTDVSIHHNVIRDSWGPGALEGIGIMVRTESGHPVSIPQINTLINANTILRSARMGILLRANSVEMQGVRVTDNTIRDSGLSGIVVEGASVHRMLTIARNALHENGKLAATNDRAGIRIASGAQVIGGRIQDNDIYDLQVTPSQTDTIYTTGATLTGVRRQGNTGEA